MPLINRPRNRHSNTAVLDSADDLMTGFVERGRCVSVFKLQLGLTSADFAAARVAVRRVSTRHRHQCSDLHPHWGSYGKHPHLKQAHCSRSEAAQSKQTFFRIWANMATAWLPVWLPKWFPTGGYANNSVFRADDTITKEEESKAPNSNISQNKTRSWTVLSKYS